MDIKIQKAKIEDCEKADNLLTKLIIDEKQYDETIDENYEVKSYYKNFVNDPNHCLYLAKIENVIVGFIYGFIIDYKTNVNKFAKIDALYTEEKYRNIGIGQKLIEEFISWSKENDVKNIEINVCNANENAKRLYTKNNFKPTKITMNLEI